MPRALLERGCAGDRKVVVLEPRRLATRLVATFVAHELGEALGERVGYRVRFEERVSAKTRLEFVTEGLLLRRLTADSTLADVGIVVLDEFHERHLAGDTALALLKELQRRARPDLRLVVMSATLDPGPLAAWLGDASTFDVPGRLHPVEVTYLDRPDDRPLAAQVASALARVVDAEPEGDVLVFLPGAREIGAAMAASERLAAVHDLELVALHGQLPLEAQQHAVEPGPRRKVVFSTNVAETSITIEGVVAVIDSGLARIPSVDPWSGVTSLRLRHVSQAAAVQRAGRAGRVRPGRAHRLYTEHECVGWAPYERPEVERLDVTDTELLVRGVTGKSSSDLGWLTSPPAASLAGATELLFRLGALAEDGGLSATGRRMLTYGVSAREARMLVEAERRGVCDEVAYAAALLEEESIEVGRPGERATTSGDSDLTPLIEAVRRAEQARFAPERLRALGLRPAVVRRVSMLASRLRRDCRHQGAKVAADVEAQVTLCVLAGYPDRVAMRRRGGGQRLGDDEVVLATGGRALVAASSVVRDASLLLALAADRRDDAASGRARVRLASALESEALLELFPDRLEAHDTWSWNAKAGRVEKVSALRYGALILEETRRAAPPGPETRDVLLREALAAGFSAFLPEGEPTRLRAQLAVVREHLPEREQPDVDDEALAVLLGELAEGCASFADLQGQDLWGHVRARVVAALGDLDALLPKEITLPSGRRLHVDYAPDAPPSVASRLQDFFGMPKTPAILAGRLPLVLHLRAPNGRDVQVTRDLAGFWERHYPSLRKELGRRYPRHAWPEDPLAAAPPRPGRAR